MKCPFCQHKELKVTDSRDASEMNAIRRRRECLDCLRRFTTFETIELTVQVHKRDGTYEDFQQQKLVNGLQAACRHTTISHDQVIALASEITGDLIHRQVREISTTELGDIVMRHLQILDPIAYIRFACVYRRFKNIEELVEAIQFIEPKDDAKRSVKVKI
jgi:transcriptional repressor NrdR